MKPRSPRLITALMISIFLFACLFQGCATDQQISEEGQQAMARIIARNAGRVVCMTKPEIAMPLRVACNIVALENSTLAELSIWGDLLKENKMFVDDLNDLLIILQGEGVLDLNFDVVTGEVLPWVRLVAKAMGQGLMMCTGLQ